MIMVYRYGIAAFNTWLWGGQGVLCCVVSDWKLGSKGNFLLIIMVYILHIFKKISLLGMEMVKLKQEIESWGHNVCLYSVNPFFFNFENISTKANYRRVDISYECE